MEVHLLDYGAGNVRSIANAIEAAGFAVTTVTAPHQLALARVLVFPGVGAFGPAMARLNDGGFTAPLRAHLAAGRPFFGICLGLQTLFEASDESPGVPGLGLIPGAVTRFPRSPAYSVPHVGWNGVTLHAPSPGLAALPPAAKLYFVHSFRATPTPANAGWVAATCDYGGAPFIAAVRRGPVFATQFHPEKSGALGLAVFRDFLGAAVASVTGGPSAGVGSGEGGAATAFPPVPLEGAADAADRPRTKVARRIVA